MNRTIQTPMKSRSDMLLRLLSSFILLASLLVLPKAHAAIGDTFTVDQLIFTVLSESKVTQMGTVSVGAASQQISGDIVIPSSVYKGVINYSATLIPYSAFSECTNLTSIVIPDSVTSIGMFAFAVCNKLKNIEIPVGITEIGNSAFFDCSSLTSIELPNSITSISAETFSWCTNLTKIVIPDSVTMIGKRSFINCGSLTSIVIPKSVTEIDEYAFVSCLNLKNVYFEGNAPLVTDWAFYDPAVIYYRQGTTGWKNPWKGRPTALWIETPVITDQPQSKAVMEGDSVTFSGNATGRAPLSYQWYKDGTLLEGATGASYTIENVIAEDFGNYTVVVTNELDEATSDIAVLSYLTPPTITVPPASLTVDAWAQATFQVEALGADSYQWYRNDIPISGATGVLYTIDSAKGVDVGTYKVVVTNRAGSTTVSATLTLTQPYRATGTVQVVNGFVVGLNITDGGWGYTREPKFRIKDETGKGATGHCVIENGVITQIIVDNPGSKYSGEATLLIGSPFSNSRLRIGASEVEVEMNLVLGMEYQLWSSVDCINWERAGEPFTAEEEEMTFFFKVEDCGKFFKLQEI